MRAKPEPCLLEGFDTFEEWWNYILSRQPTSTIVEVLLDPEVKCKFINKWNVSVKEIDGE